GIRAFHVTGVQTCALPILYYAAKLCFADRPEEEIDALVLRVLEDLGLAEIRDLKVGSPLRKTISGGQRKRLNIGLELLREPAVQIGRASGREGADGCAVAG